MNIAIHHHSGSFSERWIQYCQENKINYKIVNCYASDIMQQMKECDVLLWHWHHADPKAILFARQLIYSLEIIGKKVFPNSKTCWHFDDKVGQKYLLEAVDAPLVPTYVFYTKDEALNWLDHTSFPKVFKLRGGAGASNVYLVKNRRDAASKINLAFGKGFKYTNPFFDIRSRIKKARKETSIWENIRNSPGILKKVWSRLTSTSMPIEKGYALFQDFIPNNDFDTRIIVIGNCAFGLRRYCRDNDFRASGSGKISYDADLIPKQCLQIAFSVTQKLQIQCGAFDFVKDKSGEYLIIEISYGFSMLAYDSCPGYWDEKLEWHAGRFNPQYIMIENLIKSY